MLKMKWVKPSTHWSYDPITATKPIPKRRELITGAFASQKIKRSPFKING